MQHDSGGMENSEPEEIAQNTAANFITDLAAESDGNPLNFAALPPEVKLRVFALLTATERGAAARVCREWRALMRVSTLWSDIDTTTLPACQLSHSHTATCRSAQNRRCCQFLQHVASARAVVRRLCISGDICNADWRGTLQSFLVDVRLHELTKARIDWASDGMGSIVKIFGAKFCC